MAFSDLTLTRLAQAALTVANATIYTVPAATRAIIKGLHVVNTTGAAKTVDLHIVPSAGAVGTDNALLYQTSIAARGILQSDTVFVMNAGDTLQASGSAAGCTITISGAEGV